MSELPVTEKMVPRPVMLRYLRRRDGILSGPPTEAEKADAIKVIRESGEWSTYDAQLRFLLEEAERIHEEASR